MLTLTKYTGAAEDVIIPDRFLRIGSGAFTGQAGIKNVTIPDSVRLIDEGAFDGCPKITVTYRSTKFNTQSFDKLYDPVYCQTLKANPSGGVGGQSDEGFEEEDDGFEISELGVLTKYYGSYVDVAVPNGVVEIAEKAFSEAYFKSVSLPSSLKAIKGSAFNQCKNLESVTVPFSVIYIGDFAFFGCTGLKNAAIVNERATIGYGVFDRCAEGIQISFKGAKTDLYKFERETILGGNTLIAYRGSQSDVNLLHIVEIVPHKDSQDHYVGAFEGDMLLRTIALDDNLIRIGDRSFKDCKKLSSIVVPDKAIGIGSAAFFNCVGLQSVELPSKLEFIGDYAFYKCEQLTFVEIPRSVYNIGYNAFKGCKNITVRYKGKDYTGADIESLYAAPAPVNERSPLYGLELDN